VALVRAVGVPAREVFGIRLGKSHFSAALGKSDEHVWPISAHGSIAVRNT